MAMLKCTAHFWTLRDDVVIPETDLGAFKYHGSKEGELFAGLYGTSKKSFCEMQEQTWIPSNKRRAKLKDSLTELDEIFSNRVLVHTEWNSRDYIVFIFNNGFIVHLFLDLVTSNLRDIFIDKSLEGKLHAEVICAIFRKNIIVLTYGIPHLTLIQPNGTTFASCELPLLNQTDIIVNEVQLPGPKTRRHERKLLLSPSQSAICVWWGREGGELYAWTPVVKAEDRANVLLYSCNMDLISCHYTEHDPLSVEFSSKDSGCLRITELITSLKGKISIVSTLYHIQQQLHQLQQRLLHIPSPPRFHSYSPDEQILLLGCVDGAVIVWDLQRDLCSTSRSSFIPFHASWHYSSSLFIVSSERGQLQCWDRALNPLLLRLRSNSCTRESTPVLHLSQYLRHQPSILSIKWALPPHQDTNVRKPTIPLNRSRQKSMRSSRKKVRLRSIAKLPERSEEACSPSEHLLICFERGPLLCLKFLSGCWPGCANLNSWSLCSEYIQWEQFDSAVQLLLSLSWTKVGSFEEEDLLLNCFATVVNGLLQKLKFSLLAENLLEKAVLHLMNTTIDDDSLAAPIFDSARKICRNLLLRDKINSAAKYALRLGDPDLLVQLVSSAERSGNRPLVAKATAILGYMRDSFRLTDYCSSSCSTSTSETASDSSPYSSSSNICSSCDESHRNSPVHLLEQLADVHLNEENQDQVHVISFGEV